MDNTAIHCNVFFYMTTPCLFKDFPRAIIDDYAAKKITKDEFLLKITDWQKCRGINYECRGKMYFGKQLIVYRGVVGEVINGVVIFQWNKKNIKNKTLFEFRRNVDFLMNMGGEGHGIGIR